MDRFLQKLKDSFSFTRGEAAGMSVLALLIIVILTIPYYNRSLQKEEKAVSSQKSAISGQQSVVSIQLTAFSRQHSAISIQPSAFSKRQFIKEYNFIVELNGADSLELMRLRGIGPVYAKRIIRYRELLGGYNDKEQLMEVWGMDKNRYEMIKEHLRVNRDSIHKININIVTFKKLMKHPYIGYDIARGIVEARKNHGEIINIEDIMRMKGMTDSIYSKLMPYVKVR